VTNGNWHCWAVIIRTCSDVLFNYGFEGFPAQYGTGFKTPKALYSLRSGCDLRKLRDFLYATRQALTNAFIREYMSELAIRQKQELSGLKVELEDFSLYVQDKTTNDEMFKNLSCMAFIILPALVIIEKGMRNNHMASFWSGVKTLLPLLVIRNNYKYVPVILRELGIYQYLCPDEVMEEYKLIWCFFGQGLDFILEEINRRIKRNVTRGSFQEYLVASVLHDQQSDIRAALLASLDMKPAELLGEYIEQTESLDREVDKIENYIMSKRLCQKVDDDSRNVLTSIDGVSSMNEKYLLPGMSLNQLLVYGKRETTKYALRYRDYRHEMKKNCKQTTTPKPKLPQPVKMTNKEVKSKKRMSAFCDSNFGLTDSDGEVLEGGIDEEDDKDDENEGEGDVDVGEKKSSSESKQGNGDEI